MKTIPIDSITALSVYLDADTVPNTPRRLYKDTDCGAWIYGLTVAGKKVDLTEPLNPADIVGVRVGTIVEGSDAEFSDTLLFPFTTQEWDDTVRGLEDAASEAWDEAHAEENDGAVFEGPETKGNER